MLSSGGQPNHVGGQEQGPKGFAHGLKLTFEQKTGAQGQDHPVGVRRKTKTVHHTRRDHQGRRGRNGVTMFVQQHLR